MRLAQVFKQVIVVNDALNLPVGKLSAQVAHAAVAAFLDAREKSRNSWVQGGMRKVVLKCDFEAKLRDLFSAAKAGDLPAALITDAGKTVVPEGTVTCLGIGPADEGDLDA